MNLLVVLADGWGYTHGGINVFNREMCKGFSGFISEKLRVICLAPDISVDEINKVKRDENIDLISLSKKEFDNPKDIVEKIKQYRVSNRLNDLSVTWLGHDAYSDYQAIECKNYWPYSRCAIIHHMAYGTYYPLVNTDTEKTLEKEENQRKRLKAADIVFANGPLLKRSAQDLRGGEDKVYEILPGIYQVKNIKESFIPNIFSVVTFGRVEPAQGTKRNNSIIKQIFLAAASWSKFTNSLRPNQESIMKVYGKSGDGVDSEVMDIVKKHFKSLRSFTMIPYENDHSELLEKLADYSLCLVLSSKEGFGLTATEAISAGVPIIVSKSSGFYQSLQERGLDGFVHSIEVDASLDEPYYSTKDLERATEEIKEVYHDQKNAKIKAIKLREELIKEGYTWENCAKTILEKLDWLDETNTFKEENVSTSNIENDKDYTLAERIILGQDVEPENEDLDYINDAFEVARQYYLSCIKPYNNENSLYDKDLFRNINVHDTSIRFLYSQESLRPTYTVQKLCLDAIEAAKYGFDYRECIPNLLWEDEYHLSNEEQEYIDEAEKTQKRLVDHSIPEGEIDKYALSALLNNGYSFEELFKMHYVIDALVRYGIEKDGLEKYYSEDEVLNAIQRAKEIFTSIESTALGKYEKFGPCYLAKKFNCKDVLSVFPVEEMSRAFKVEEILDVKPMVTVKALKRGGYSAIELVGSGFSLRQLEAAGFDIEDLVCENKILNNLETKEIEEIVKNIVFEIEEEEYKEDFLCRSESAELLKRLKEKGLKLSQIRDFLPFKLESCPCQIKWLLMACFTIDELENEDLDWKEYFKWLPPEWIDNDEYEKYQYDGVLPLELFKAGINVDSIESSYSINGLRKEIDALMETDVARLRADGYTAKAFYNMGITLEEVTSIYSSKKDEDVRELALSGYELRELNNAGFSIGDLRDQYSIVLVQYDLKVGNSNWSRYGTILDYIGKHGE
ncbi:MAG: glycosyltransferase [Lachnospiraceae bacterium]|nr:glycosyltransferase [Lachnospiraceae bacterium]